MEGPYSQILINGYPIFSGLAGVYGLELIPQNMIEKIEVVRGGGSALYGSNAVAGTINILLKEPHFNTYEAGISSGINGFGISDTDQTGDHTINFNTSLVGNDISYALYGFYRNREAFDANGDDFSELANLENMTLGNHLNYNITDKAKLTTDLFFIKEDRRGGNKFDMPNHMADISEALNHTLLTGAIKFEQDFNYSDWSLYASGQNVDRDSYYGAEQSLSDYGKTEGLTYVLGTQYNYSKDNYLLTLGYEYNYDDLKDQKLGYYDIENDEYLDNTLVADQKKTTHGVFAQAEYTLNKFKFTAGARLENYSILEEEHDKNMSETLLVPRFVLKYDINNNFQWRASYAQGYRPPQIFDEDLHIETSGSRQIIHENDPDLTKELSHSIMTSFDYNKQFNKAYFSFLVEGFYTRLDNAFANEIGEPDEDGTVIYTRVNAKEGAVVYGANIESNYIPSDKLSFKLGFTVQRSEYEEAQDFEEKAFFRTPNAYGFLMADIDMGKGFGLNTSMNYTGSMLVPHYDEVLVETDGFLDWGIKLDYDWAIKNETHLNLYTGVKNILNSYQDDFDTGIDRDPAYIYGPGNPRMIYFGLKIGNNLL
jgi:outer membrane receptor for ferrienterochelin and colicins